MFRRSCAAFILLFSSSALVYAGSPHTEAPVPEAIAVPEDQQLAVELIGIGVQRYECAAVDTGHTWRFIEPDAMLVDRHGRPAGHHGRGPFWAALDGSRVVARKIAEADVSDNSIPWLLLEATSRSGQGLFEDISFIQRIDTDGGLAPESSCTEANSGERADIPYRARYRFYRPAHCARN